MDPPFKAPRSLAGKLFHVVGDAAGKLATTVEKAAESTGRRAALTFVSGRRSEIPSRTSAELSEALSQWLSQRQKGEGEARGTIEVRSLGDERFALRFQESGLMARRYLFLFAPLADPATTDAFEKELTQSEHAGGGLVVLTWPTERLRFNDGPGECPPLFLWDDGVRLGSRTAASDYVSAWLLSWLGFQPESMRLIDISRGPQGDPGLFIGRTAELAVLTQALAQPHRSPGVPWILSLTGLGGTGKSYLLKQVEQRFGRRTLYAQVDHQSCETRAEEGLSGALMSLLSGLVGKLERAGCPCSRFNKVYARLLRSPQKAAAKVKPGVAGFLTQAFDMSKRLNPVLLAAEAGLQLYDSYARELREEGEALASSSKIQRLTRALVEDLSQFVERQRKRYYLWRRPVLAFDTYEITGLLLDTWLRTSLLTDPEFLALEPAILVAGRYELVRVNTRWSELQSSLRTIHLDSFDAGEADKYLQSLGMNDPARREQALELTGGSPLFLSLAANASSPETAVKALAERILEEVEPAHRQLYLEAAVPDGFNKDVLRKILAPELVDDAFERLSRATFVRAEAGQWRFAPTVRQILLQCLGLESPERLKMLQQALH